MNSATFKKYMYNLAMKGKLNTQNPDDEHALVLLDTIIKNRKQLVKDKKIKKTNNEIFIFRENGSYYEKVGNNEPTCINDEIPFKIPDSWVWCTLGNIVSVKGGKRVPKGYKLLDEPTPHIYIRVTNMKNGTITDKDIKYIDDEIYEKIKNYTISKNDLYITVAGTIGQIGSVPDFFDGMNLTENANKITDISINKSFLKYLMMSDIVQSQLISKTTQVAQPKLAIKRITSVKIPLPPIKEQQRIVNILDKVNKYVFLDEKLKDLNLNFFNNFKKLILQEAVQGKLVPQDLNDEPASILLDKIKQEKEQLIKDKKIKRNNKESLIYKDNGSYFEKIGKKEESVCIDDEIPFEIPDSWCWSRLDNIVELINGDRGKNYPAKSKLSNTGEIPFISAINLSNGEVNDNNLLYLSNEQYNLLSRGKLKNNDLIFCLRGSLGKNGIFKMNKGAIASSLVILRRYLNDIDLKYFFYYINSNLLYSEIKKYDNGTAQPNLSASNLKQFFVPIPPLNEQKRIVDKIEQLFENIDVLID